MVHAEDILAYLGMSKMTQANIVIVFCQAQLNKIKQK